LQIRYDDPVNGSAELGFVGFMGTMVGCKRIVVTVGERMGKADRLAREPFDRA
jgi:hypothetical protein